jgi:4-amino-4-deoxy-L-arabinose transferase-like glycosyltransferase
MVRPDSGTVSKTRRSLFVRQRYLLLLVLGLTIYVPFLGLRTLWYPNEPTIAEICRAMFLSGDWIAPRRMGVIFVDYPPMVYWTGALCSHLFGTMSEFTLRLPSALAGIGTALVTCWAGSRWFGPRAGLWAGLALLTMVQFVYNAVGFRPDVLFTLFIAAGLVVYAEGAGDKPRSGLRGAGFVLLGAAMLTKGPLGVLLPGLVLVLWHGSRREWRRLLELAPLALVSIAVYLLWFIPGARAMGAERILDELYLQNVARFFSGFRGHQEPIFDYLKVFWIDLWPWSFAAPFAGWWVLRSRLRSDRNAQLALWWFGTFLVFLSVAVTKRQLYLLPAYPAVALLVGLWLASLLGDDPTIVHRPDPRPLRSWGVGVAGIFAVVGLVGLGAVAGFDGLVARADLDPPSMDVALGLRMPLAFVGALLLLAGCWIATAWWRRQPRVMTARVVASHLAMYVVLLGWILPAFEPAKSYRPQSRWIREQIGDQPSFGMVWSERHLGVRKRAAFSYYTGATVDLLETRADVDDYFRRHPDTIVLIHDREAAAIFAGDEAEWQGRVIRKLRKRKWVFVVVRGS